MQRIILILLGIGAIIAVVVGSTAIGATRRDGTNAAVIAQPSTAIVYTSPTCGCCANYIAYLKRVGYSVEVRSVDDAQLAAVKDDRGVPATGRSCHTAEIAGYTIEGHVPVEAIDRLLAERPAVRGIGLAGMPSGSPGMPGTKTATFDVYAFATSSTMTPFGKF
ncbi:MAG: DUF411 domain-containing protein [bacterium]|nr:DUF411 domain-containing protein [bacterium]